MKLVLDFDSTLVGFTEAWCLWLEKEFGKKVTNQDINSYNWPSRIFGPTANDFFRKDPHKTYREWIKPIPMSPEFVRWCILNFDTHILTHADEEKTKEAKTEFVRKHYGNIQLEFFDTMNDKYIHIKDCVLVDDYPHHIIMNASRNGSHSIVFDYKGEYGWSKLENYWDLIWKEKTNLQHIHVAHTYDSVVSILKILKGNSI